MCSFPPRGWQSYLLVFGLAVSIPCQLFFLNRALAFFDATFVVPTLQCFWSLSSICMGDVFFEEFDAWKPWMGGVFAVGVALSISGVATIAYDQYYNERSHQWQCQRDGLRPTEGFD